MADFLGIRWSFTFILLASVAACGGNVVVDGSGTGTAGAGGSVSPGSGPGGGTLVGTTSGGGTPGSTVTVGPGGSGGSTPAVTCPGNGAVAFQGTLDGVVFPPTVIPVDTAGGNTGGIGDFTPVPDGLVGYQLANPSAPPDQPNAITGLLFLPMGGQDPHVWFAFGPGSTLLVDSQGNQNLDLQGLRNLGVCPAAQGSGSLSLCDFGACPGGAMTSTTGSVDGTSFDWGSNAVNSLGPYMTWANGAELALVGGPGNLTAGMLLMPPVGPDPGAYYCVGTWTVSGSTAIFGNLTRVGTAAQAKPAGSLSGCFGG